MTKKQAIHVEVIKRTERNAVLVTDGTKACWMQGRCVREDGTLTKWGRQLIAEAKMTDAEARDYNTTMETRRAEREVMYEIEREARREAARDLTLVTFRKDHWFKGSEKAFKIWTGGFTISRYKQRVRDFIYVPYGQVQVEKKGDTVEVMMPLWLKDQHERRWTAAIAQ